MDRPELNDVAIWAARFGTFSVSLTLSSEPSAPAQRKTFQFATPYSANPHTLFFRCSGSFGANSHICHIGSWPVSRRLGSLVSLCVGRHNHVNLCSMPFASECHHHGNAKIERFLFCVRCFAFSIIIIMKRNLIDGSVVKCRWHAIAYWPYWPPNEFREKKNEK